MVWKLFWLSIWGLFWNFVIAYKKICFYQAKLQVGRPKFHHNSNLDVSQLIMLDKYVRVTRAILYSTTGCRPCQTTHKRKNYLAPWIGLLVLACLMSNEPGNLANCCFNSYTKHSLNYITLPNQYPPFNFSFQNNTLGLWPKRRVSRIRTK